MKPDAVSSLKEGQLGRLTGSYAMMTMKSNLAFLTVAVIAKGCHAFFSYPSLSSASEPKTFFNVTSNTLADNLLVLNKTTTAESVGFYLASAFLAYTMLYTYEENNPSSKSKVDSVFGFFSNSDKDKKEKSSGISDSKNCDCETYCSNKYYYGEQPADNYYYSKRWADSIRSALL